MGGPGDDRRRPIAAGAAVRILPADPYMSYARGQGACMAHAADLILLPASLYGMEGGGGLLRFDACWRALAKLYWPVPVFRRAVFPSLLASGGRCDAGPCSHCFRLLVPSKGRYRFSGRLFCCYNVLSKK